MAVRSGEGCKRSTGLQMPLKRTDPKDTISNPLMICARSAYQRGARRPSRPAQIYGQAGSRSNLAHQSRGGRRLKSFPRNQRRYRLRISETVPSFGASGTGLRACLVLPGWNSGMPSPVPMEYAPAKGPYGSAARPVKRQQTVTRLRKQRRGTVQTVLPGTAAPLLAGPPVQLISSRQNVRRVE